MNQPFIQFAKWASLTAGLAAASSALAATPAGTTITNQASATFAPVTPGGPSAAQSNTVSTTVQAVCAVSVTNVGAGSALTLGGGVASFVFTVTNAGNDSFNIPLALSSTGMTPMPNLTLYLDSNKNGVVDAGEQPVSALNLPANGTANVIAQVKTQEGSQGEALLNLVASCAAGGAAASANARVTVNPPPRLNVTKTFDPAQIRPGQDTNVSVSTTNSSEYASREVILTDPLAEQLAQGLEFVPNSAATNVGVIEYTADGNTWTTTQPTRVVGIRVRAETLAPGASINLRFRMRANEAADGKQVVNVATALTGGQSTQGQATVNVRYTPGVAIGPVGNPLAPEGTPADSQTQPFATVGQQICFDHTLQNTGDVADNFRITITFPQGSATTTLLGENGQPLVQPLRLDPGQTALVRVCYTPTAAGTLEALITATGERGTSNTTRDIIGRIEAEKPDLKKSYVATRTENGQTIQIPAGGTVSVGDTITYTLEVVNPYSAPLNDVVITDPLPAHLDFISASDGGLVSGDVDAQSVTWRLGTLAAGERRTFTIVTKVSDRAVDGESLQNIFNLVSTEIATPVPSNPVQSPVWSAQLLIEKTVSAQEVTYGERLTYTLRIRNTSETTDVTDARITDTPARGLEYIAGTSTLEGAALADPTITNGSLGWRIPVIPARGEVILTYEMRVTPEATGTLDNTVIAVGQAGEYARAIASNRAVAVTRINPLKFAAIGDIIGTVFIDRNRNGLYEKGFDTPVERARVLLAGGRIALTDKFGKYKFANVPLGTQSLRLDPNTTPYPPLTLPQDGGLSGTQSAYVRGLTTVNFPLIPLGGDISELRRTTLTMGDLRVQKVVYADQDKKSYYVELKLSTPASLTDFELTDPLPEGAVLKEGRNTLSGTLPAGETNLTYRFEWAGEPRAATTDPVVRWRY